MKTIWFPEVVRGGEQDEYAFAVKCPEIDLVVFDPARKKLIGDLQAEYIRRAKSLGYKVTAGDGKSFKEQIDCCNYDHAHTSLYVVRAYLDGRWKPIKFTMEGDKGTHSLAYDSTNAQRLRCHWEGFCQNHGIELESLPKWDKHHFYL